MAITLQDFASGDTNYISKLNSNNAVLEAAVGALQNVSTPNTTAMASFLPLIRRLFGTGTRRLGYSSCTAEISGQTVVVSDGWVLVAGNALAEVATGTPAVDLSGFGNATIYININNSGGLSASTDPSEYDLYSVAKSGTTLSGLTEIAEAGFCTPTPYDVTTFIPGTMSNAQLLTRHVFARSVTFPAGLADSYCSSTVAATSGVTLTIKRDGVSIGTISFAGAGSTGTFSFTTTRVFTAGQILTIEGPATADGTLGNVSITMVGGRE